MNYLLGTSGILDITGKQVSTPFDNKLVHHGLCHDNMTFVIVDRHQIWRYDQNWNHILTSDDELNCLLSVDGRLLVGTEKARLAWVRDGNLSYIGSFDSVDNRDQWSTPWGGPPDVRSLSLGSDETIYANIHVGWIVQSTDSGSNWQPRTSGLHKDVHQVAAHPEKKDIIAAATAGGFHISLDHGKSFERRWDISPTYQRAVAWFPETDIILTSVSSGPSGHNSRLYRSNKLGQSWSAIDLPVTPQDNINTYQLTLLNEGVGYVIVNYSTVCKTEDYGQTWEVVSNDLPKTYQLLYCK